jgi:hypothetical protein
MVNYRASVVSTVVGGVAVVELYTAGTFFDNCQSTVAAAGGFVEMGATVLLDLNAATTLLEVKTSGAVTSGASSEVYIWAVRVG